MRRTGSRELRERRDASATSPTSIAVKTFSIRLESRRIQRPSHQKMRSSTTARAVSETTRIGHMIGPPLRKLSTKKFLSIALSGIAATDGLALAAGGALAVVVAGDVAAVAGVMPAAGGTAAAAGLVTVAGAAGGAAGSVGGVWPKEINTSVTEQRLAISSFFIDLIGIFFNGLNSNEDLIICLSSKRCVRFEQKTFAFLFSTFRLVGEPSI